MPKPERRVFTPADILERARAGEPTTGLFEGRVAVETWDADDLDIRTDGDGMTFHGYAAVFDSESEDLGGFRETVRHTAFDKTLGGRRAIKMFWNHNPDILLGSTRAIEGERLTLGTDQRGLVAENRFPETTAGRDMAELVRTKRVDSMSFGFQVVKDAWSADYTHRELIEVRLFEVSPVTGWPAYPMTSASVRDLAETVDADPEELAQAIDAVRAIFLGHEGPRLSRSQASLLTKVINRHSDFPVRAAAFTGADADKYAAFLAALS